MSCSDNSEIIDYKDKRRMPAPPEPVGKSRQKKDRKVKPYALQSRCDWLSLRGEWQTCKRYRTYGQANRVAEKYRRSASPSMFQWRVVGPDGKVTSV